MGSNDKQNTPNHKVRTGTVVRTWVKDFITPEELEHLVEVWTTKKVELFKAKELGKLTNRMLKIWAIESIMPEIMCCSKSHLPELMSSVDGHSRWNPTSSRAYFDETVRELLVNQYTQMKELSKKVYRGEEIYLEDVKQIHKNLSPDGEGDLKRSALISPETFVSPHSEKGQWRKGDVSISVADIERQKKLAGIENIPPESQEEIEKLTRTGITERLPVCSPTEIEEEMKKVVDTINHPGDENTPECTAAKIYHKMIEIYPFDQGNERVAQALVMFFLLKFNRTPFVIDQWKYKDKLAICLENFSSDPSMLEMYMAQLAKESLEKWYFEACLIGQCQGTLLNSIALLPLPTKTPRGDIPRFYASHLFRRAEENLKKWANLLRDLNLPVKSIRFGRAVKESYNYYRTDLERLSQCDKAFNDYTVDAESYYDWLCFKMDFNNKTYTLVFPCFFRIADGVGEMVVQPFIHEKDKTANDSARNQDDLALISDVFVVDTDLHLDNLRARFELYTAEVIARFLVQTLDPPLTGKSNFEDASMDRFIMSLGAEKSVGETTFIQQLKSVLYNS